MSVLPPFRPPGGHDGPDSPEPHLQGARSYAERVARWEVRAAQWRAVELARAAFGHEVRSSLLGVRSGGRLRGLLKLDVPFDDLESHRRREAAFLGMVRADPVMLQVPLLFVVGPDAPVGPDAG